MKAAIALGLVLVFVSGSRAETNSASLHGGGPVGHTTSDSVSATNEITFAEFLKEVAAANLDYAAHRYDVSIAEAAVAAARQFQNPTLALVTGSDVSHSGHERMPDTVGATLTQSIELGGKRKYRILGARENYAVAAATLQDFLRNLKLDAAAAFAEALALARTASQKRESAEFLRRFADTQRERFHAGDLSRADLLQSQIEEQQFQNEMLAARADAENASIALSGFLGRERGQTLLIPKGELGIPPREFQFPELLTHALKSRPDLLALRKSRDAAEAKISEERRNRIPNVEVGPSWTHNSSSQNSISPSQGFESVGVSLSVPLPLWNRNKPAIASAGFAAEQAQKQLEAAELKTEVQIRQAFSSYRSALDKVRRYQGGILNDADAVLEAKRFSYQRGQAALLELLDAQRTANEVHSAYITALADEARALIELQRAAGLWEIEF